MANADDIIRVRLVLDESTVSAVENRVRNIVNRLNSQQFNIQVNQTSINNAIARLRELENTANRIQNQNININANLTTAQQSYRLETERLRVSQQLAVQRELTAQSENRAIAALSAQNRTLNITRTNTENINQNVEHTYNNLRNANNAGNDFANHLARGLQYLLQYRILNSILSSVTDAVAEIKDLDKELIAYRKATNATEDEMKSLTKTAFQTAKAMGQVPSAYGKAISTFGKAGYRDTAKELSELSLLTQSVGDVDADISNQFLLATDKAYKYQGSIESLTKVLDGANSIENNYATSIQKVADGMGLIAPLAAQQEVAVNELMAGLGTITAVTQRSGSEAARSLRALILNIRGVKGAILDETTGEMLDDASIKKTEEVLNKYGFKIREFKNGAEDLREPMKVVEEIANSLKSGALSEVGLQEITDTIGGKLRSSQLTALISNFDMYKQMLKTYSEADGSARREMEISLDSYEKKLQSVKASWAEYIASLADSRTVKNAIDALGVAIDMLNTPIGKVLSQIILINTALTVSSRLWQMIRSRSIVADILSLGVAEGNLKDAIGLVNGHLREQAVHFLSSPTGQFAAGLTLVIGVIEGVKFAIKQHNDAIQTYVNSQKEIISTADENIQKYEEEKSSLESLQKKLSEARGDKTKLSEVTIELNKAIGNTPDLLNDEANAYDIANAKIRARIKELGDLTTAEKNRKVNAQREIFKSNETSVKFGTDDMTAVGLSIDIKEAS